MHSAKAKIQFLKKKLKLPAGEHPMDVEVAQVEVEKEQLLQDLLQKNEEISKLKEMNDMLQKKLDSHVCTIVVSSDSEGPTAKLKQVMTELRMVEIDLKNTQRELEKACKVIKVTKQEVFMTKENVEKYRRVTKPVFRKLRS